EVSGKENLECDPRRLIASRAEACPGPVSASDSSQKHHARWGPGRLDLFPLRTKNQARRCGFATGSEEGMLRRHRSGAAAPPRLPAIRVISRPALRVTLQLLAGTHRVMQRQHLVV